MLGGFFISDKPYRKIAIYNDDELSFLLYSQDLVGRITDWRGIFKPWVVVALRGGEHLQRCKSGTFQCMQVHHDRET